MAKFGKWIGGGLGWAFGGPIGALIGFALGTIFDSAEITTVRTTKGSGNGGRSFDPFSTDDDYAYNPRTAQGDFVMSLLVLSAAVMKSDAKVMRSELEYVKSFLERQFGAAQAKQLLPVLQEVLKKDIPLREVCMQIRRYMPEAQRLQLLHYLFGIGKADGDVSAAELKTIEQIANYLGVNTADFTSVKAMYFRDELSDYKILEIESGASDDELKKAYRRMAVKYHPDKVADLGEEAQKTAKEKFQKVQEAYENIKKKRGLV
jgi:DnaJ like chaperone protein